MQSYKHSCPCCGQHIEYTAEYCGKQTKCPTCGQPVTFPAIPSGRAKTSVRSSSLAATQAPRKGPGIFASLRNFEHWNVVAQCVVPFLIIAVLLGAALFVKNKMGASASVGEASPVVQADPEALQRMTDLIKAEEAVQSAIKILAQDHAQQEYEEQVRSRVDRTDALAKKNADDRVQRAASAVTAARKQFEAANAKYYQLGGTKDYRSQVRQY